MSTARIVVTNSLRTAGVIDPVESPNDNEISHGLNELNLLIDSLNLDNLFPYTSVRKSVILPTNTGKISIGEGDGIPNVSTEDDGATTTITTRKNNSFFTESKVTVSGLENYNIVDQVVIYHTDKTVKVPPQNIPPNTTPGYFDNITSIVDNGGNFDITYTAPVSYAPNDVIIVTDQLTYSLTATVIINVGSTITVSGEMFGKGLLATTGVSFYYIDRVPTALEIEGYTFPEGALIPDIISPRPNDLQNIKIIFDSIQYVLEQYSPNDWDKMSFSPAVAGRPYYYTYFPYFPFGEINIYPETDSAAYTTEIKYESVICNFSLDDEIHLPPGYESVLQYELARILSPQYGVMNPLIEREANKRMAQLKRQNYKPTSLINDAPSSSYYDIHTDGYR